MKKFLVGLLVAGIVLAALAFGGERFASAAVANRISSAVSAAVPGIGSVSTSIEDGPVTPQLAKGTLSHVKVTMNDVPLQGGMALSKVDVDLTNVSTSSPRTAGTVVAHATLTTDQIQKLLGDAWKVTPQGDSLNIATTGALPITGTVQPVVQEGKLNLNLTGVTVLGVQVDPANIPAIIKDRLNGLTAGFGSLPLGLELSTVAVTQAGVDLTANGANVTLDNG
jgi:hypothetical protein